MIVHDRRGGGGERVLEEIRRALRSLTQIVLGANSLVMSAVPRLLTPTPGGSDSHCIKQFKEHYMSTLRGNVIACKDRVAGSEVLSMVVPQGALYAMIRIDFTKLRGVGDDADFARMMLLEENLSVLPGCCFGLGGFVRLVTCPPREVLEEAVDRMMAFCARHAAVAV